MNKDEKLDKLMADAEFVEALEDLRKGFMRLARVAERVLGEETDVALSEEEIKGMLNEG